MQTRKGAKIISVANQKGGVGKTTTVINLSTSLAAIKQRVLIVDFDPQGNIATGLGLNKSKLKKTVYDLLFDTDPNSIILKTSIPMLDVMSSNQDLAAAEVELFGLEDKHSILASKLRVKYFNNNVVRVNKAGLVYLHLTIVNKNATF